ncbi:MAG TPA: hypothetical protein ENI23_04860 [bacterium]|nr:hypothetical protein [bacterium]
MKEQKADIVRLDLIKRACKKQEKENLKLKGKSLIWTSMFDHVLRVFAEEVYADSPEALMKIGWRDFIKTL